MGDFNQLKLLKKGSEGWNAWKRENFKTPVDLSDTDLSGADLRHVELHSVDLSKANMCGAKLYNAFLHGAKLSGADLQNATLRESNLQDADLFGARLDHVDFTRANLKAANLGGASLIGANFSWSKLSQANFDSARLAETVFGGTDLTKTIGLDRCDHLGPCIVDHHTREQSCNVPLSFWEGCGLPEIFIRYQPSTQSHSIEANFILISHHNDDRAFAQQLHDHLQMKGMRCWLDELKPTWSVQETLNKLNYGQKCSIGYSLLCISRSLTDDSSNHSCDFNFSGVLNREKEGGLLKVIPMNLDGSRYDRHSHCFNGRKLQQRFVHDFTNWEQDKAKFETKADEVIEALTQAPN